MSMRLIKEANNFYRLDLHPFSFWFSYETCVAFSTLTDLYISENVWSQITGKHLNLLNPEQLLTRNFKNAFLCKVLFKN
jgi:hypothetical protein